jgi:hypothetical protein
MRTPLVLLKAIARAALYYCGVGVWEIAVEAVSEIGDNAWREWSREKDKAGRRAEMEALVRASHKEILDEVRQAVHDVAGKASAQVRDKLAGYLSQVQALAIQTMRRPSDPTGRTLRPRLALENPADLLPFIPARKPRFSPGDRPLQQADWKLVELQGVGGFGEVWKAEHAHFPDVSDHGPRSGSDTSSRLCG